MNIMEGGTYRHVKRGTTYEVIGRAKMQIGWKTMHRAQVLYAPEKVAGALEKMSMVVYRSLDDDTFWVRPESEFCDGRFKLLRQGYYIFKRAVDGSRYYYKSGEGRGWRPRKSEATFYTEVDFAERDRANLFASSERGVVSIEPSTEE